MIIKAVAGLLITFGLSGFALAQEPDQEPDQFRIPPVAFRPLLLQPLAKITNDRTSDVQQLFAIIDETLAVTGIEFLTQHADGSESTKSFTMQQISQGAVLDGDSSHDVFILLGQVDGAGSVADMTVRYLSNGLTGSYKECGVSLLRSADGTWGLYNANSSVVIDSIVITTWSLGIDQVQNVCE